MIYMYLYIIMKIIDQIHYPFPYYMLYQPETSISAWGQSIILLKCKFNFKFKVFFKLTSFLKRRLPLIYLFVNRIPDVSQSNINVFLNKVTFLLSDRGSSTSSFSSLTDNKHTHGRTVIVLFVIKQNSLNNVVLIALWILWSSKMYDVIWYDCNFLLEDVNKYVILVTGEKFMPNFYIFNTVYPIVFFLTEQRKEWL